MEKFSALEKNLMKIQSEKIETNLDSLKRILENKEIKTPIIPKPRIFLNNFHSHSVTRINGNGYNNSYHSNSNGHNNSNSNSNNPNLNKFKNPNPLNKQTDSDPLNEFKKVKKTTSEDLEMARDKRLHEISKFNNLSKNYHRERKYCEVTQKNKINQINDKFPIKKIEEKESKISDDDYVQFIRMEQPLQVEVQPSTFQSNTNFGSLLFDNVEKSSENKKNEISNTSKHFHNDIAISKNRKLESLLVGFKSTKEYDDFNTESTSKSNDKNHIGPIRYTKKDEDEYRYYKFNKEEIFQKVLDFNFFRDKIKLDENMIIPNMFSSVNHYKYIWINNFFYELKHSLIAAKIENSIRQKYIEADIRIRFLSTNYYMEGISTFNVNFNKNLDFQKLKIFKENDIFAIYRDRDFNQNPNQIQNTTFPIVSNLSFDFENKKNSPYILGIISYEKLQSNENSEIIFKINEKNTKDITNDYYSVFILGNLTTSLREYNSIIEIENLSLFPVLWNPNDFISNKKDLTTEGLIENSTVKKFIHNITSSEKFNESQKEAIRKVYKMDNREILLIQGPPGTGKTHSIIGIISLILLQNPKNKILVCAPSNAAIDEISLRIAQRGVLNEDLASIFQPFIRFGLYDRLDKESKELNSDSGKILQKFSIEKLIEKKFAEKEKLLLTRLEKLRHQCEEKEKENARLKKIMGESNSALNKNELLEDLKENEENKKMIIGEMKSLKKEKKINSHDKKIYERELLEANRVLCSTLNSAGNERLRLHNVFYEYVIIDEACQSVEPSSVIALTLGAQKVIMVGDHMQLPATVFSDKATLMKYNRSLFERLIDNKYPRHMLNVQYRMESNIRRFVGKTFYNDKLHDDFNTIKKINKSSFYDIINKKKNFAFFDLKYSQEKFLQGSKSYINDKEVAFVINILKSIQYLIDNFNNHIGNQSAFLEINNKIVIKYAIITPYKAQVKLITEEVFKQLPKMVSYIEVNTVDSFQGREQDIVIISTVRSNFGNDSGVGIGFLNDYRRMNVALSRARLACFIVGNSDTLIQNEYWHMLIGHCLDNQSIFPIREEYMRANWEINGRNSFFIKLVGKEQCTVNNSRFDYEEGEVRSEKRDDFLDKDIMILSILYQKYKNIFVKNGNNIPNNTESHNGHNRNTEHDNNLGVSNPKLLGRKKQFNDKHDTNNNNETCERDSTSSYNNSRIYDLIRTNKIPLDKTKPHFNEKCQK